VAMVEGGVDDSVLDCLCYFEGDDRAIRVALRMALTSKRDSPRKRCSERKRPSGAKGAPGGTRRRKKRKREITLWGEDVFGVGFDLDGGEAGGIPAAAEGFHQEDAGY